MALGLALMPISCLCSSSGLLLMKSASDLHPTLPPYRSPRWLAGFFLLGVCATSVDIVVLGILPLSVVAPFAGLNIVFTLLISATGCLTEQAERFTWADARSTGLVLLGVTLVSAFGPHNSAVPTVDGLITSFSRQRFACFAGVALGTALTWLCVCDRGRGGELKRQLLAPLLCTDGEGGGGGATGLSAFAAACMATLSQLMLKLVSTALRGLPGALGALGLGLAGLSVTAPLHLHLLNRTLEGGAVAVAVPLYQSMLIIISSAAGGLLFNEFERLDTTQCAVYTLGLLIATAGLAVLSSHAPIDDDDDSYEAGDELGELPMAGAPGEAADEDSSWESRDSNSELLRHESWQPPPYVAGQRSRRRTMTRRDSAIFTVGLGFGHAIRDFQTRTRGRRRAVSQPAAIREFAMQNTLRSQRMMHRSASCCT